jgi:hypothetical protein
MANAAFALGQSGQTGKNISHVECQPDAIHDGASGGLFFSETELPVAGTFSTPATLGGFSPSPIRSEQKQASGDATGGTGNLAPAGLRR